MTVLFERIRSTLAPRFPNLEQIEHNVLRFEQKSHGRAYAVCYVATPEKIPDSKTSLNDYQERIVASRYFQGDKSLQWSNYLFLVVDAEPNPELRAVIERDRRYARKFVLTEPELEAALMPPVYQVPGSTIKSDILSEWTQILADNNLDRAVLNDESLPSRIKLIEARHGQAAVPVRTSRVIPKASNQPFLRQIELKKYRPFPLVRAFDVGAVTLICGPNGSGKTSLMEAIELIYCGQTKRNPKDKSSYSILATYSDGKTELASHRRQPSVFRDRNLAWYGQLDQRSTSLYQAFARFNFLDTDAAVGLADPKSDSALEEDLSKLMIGPDASKVWKEIERTAEKLDDEIREQQSVNRQMELELSSLNRQTAASSSLNQESGAVLAHLDNLLSARTWKRSEGEASDGVKSLVESLSAYGALALQAIKCDWIPAPISILALETFAKNGRSRAEIAEGQLQKISVVADAERHNDRGISQLDRKLGLLRELLVYLDSGFPQSFNEIASLEPLITRFPQFITDMLADAPLSYLEAAGHESVESLVSSAADQVTRGKQNLVEVQQQYSAFNSLRNESERLVQQLRFVADQILQKSSNPDICPLCHSAFKEGELASHFHRGVDQQIEERGTALLSLIRELEQSLQKAESLKAATDLAFRVCQYLGESPAISVARLVDIASEQVQANAEQVERYKLQTSELARLQRLGITSDRFRQLLESLSLGSETPTAESVRSDIEYLEQSRSTELKEKEGLRKTIQELRQAATEALRSVTDANLSVESAISQLKERLVRTDSLLSQLELFQATLPFPSDNPLSELVLSIESIREVAGDFQATLSREQIAVSVLDVTSKRKAEIEEQLSSRTPRVQNLIDARSVLARIQNEHSLEGAMEEALRQNRSGIEGIFSRIHSPAEFSKIGNSLTTLVRKNSGETATLQQISTGQRAAFALSLFLAQNAQLRHAPPLILIDDPIAHVDDLNCLSFLDYLREVVIAGERQVVFATANDRLAALFERKFDFLGGEEFKRHDLSR